MGIDRTERAGRTAQAGRTARTGEAGQTVGTGLSGSADQSDRADYAETVIVGGGAAGMNCALELKKAGKPYLLLSDYLGGRILNDDDLHMNYGAVFFFGNYDNMLDPEKNIIQPTTDVLPKLTDGFCHPDPDDDARQFAALSGKTLRDAPSLIRYMGFMNKEFLPRYKRFKDNCEVMEVRTALEKDPLINELYHQTADEMIKQRGFGGICDDLISMFAHACTGSRIKTLSALDYLNCVQPLTLKLPSLERVLCIKRFDFDKEGMARRLREGAGRAEFGDAGTVVAVERAVQGGAMATGARWRVTCKDGSVHECENLVMATPIDVTARLLAGIDGLPELEVRNASQLYGYILECEPRPAFERGIVHIFSDETPIIFIARRKAGQYEIFTEVEFEESRRFDRYFKPGWKVLGSKFWPKALFTNPNYVNPNNLAPGLVLAGDCNGLGMEPAAVSGVYAANKILGKTVD